MTPPEGREGVEALRVGARHLLPAAERTRDLDVALITGGTSGERDIALITADAIAGALGDDGDGRGPRRVDRIEWNPTGDFSRGADCWSFGRLLDELAAYDVTLLALHGGAGEDGRLQGALEVAGVAYTGSGPGASALAMNKTQALRVAASLGVAIPAGITLGRTDRDSASLTDFAGTRPAGGWFVKPESGGSSEATFHVARDADLVEAVDAALERTPRVRIEAAVEGTEVTCPIVGEGPRAESLMPVEIRPAHGRFFDAEQKYASDGAVELCPPESFDAATIAAIREAALQIHRGFGCRGLSRVDFIVDASGRPTFLELNTLPGFTARSLAPLSAAHCGLSFRGLCLVLLDQALITRPG